MLIRKKSAEKPPTSAATTTASGEAAATPAPRVVDLQKVIDLRAKLDANRTAAAAASTGTGTGSASASEPPPIDDTPIKPVSAAAIKVIKRCLRMYREMVPPVDILTELRDRLIEFDSGTDYRAWEIQSAVHELILLDPLCTKRYGPSPAYCDSFAKLYIHHIESKKLDVYDPLYEEAARLFKAAVAYSKDRHVYRGPVPRMCAKTFQMSDEDGDTLSIFFNEGLNHAVGLSAWPGGLFAAEFILHHSAMFTNRTCLELGAGVGFTSLALCRIGAKRVITTDYEPDVIQLLAENMKSNGFGVTSTDAAAAAAVTATAAAPIADTKSSPAAAAPAAAAGAGAALNSGATADAKSSNDSASAAAASGGGAATANRGVVAPPPSVIRVEKLDWFEFDESLLPQYASDITIASDTIYAPELIPPQMKIFQMLCGAKNRPRITSHLSPIPIVDSTPPPPPPPAVSDVKGLPPTTAAAGAAPAASGEKVRFVPPPTPVMDLTRDCYDQLPVVFLILCVRNEDTFAYLLRCLWESGLNYLEVDLTAVPRRFTYRRHALKCFRIVRKE